MNTRFIRTAPRQKIKVGTGLAAASLHHAFYKVSAVCEL